jgi:hypothetical protein
VPRGHGIKTAFNGGELSPLLAGRTDLTRYASGCRALFNMLPTVQGPAKRRGGTRYAASVRTHAARAWLARFEFSRTQAYILEFSPGWLRFFTNRAQLLSGAAAYEIATPYLAGDLTNADGAFGLRMVQSGDVVYIACPGKPAKKLTRLGVADWVLTDYVPKNGPFQDENTDRALKIAVSARTGTVTATASAAYFSPAMVGHLLRLDVESFSHAPWEPGKAYAAGTRVRSDGKTYVATNADGSRKSGTKTPIHEEGTALDGSGMSTDTTPVPIGIEWQYEDAGYGVGVITGYTSATVVQVSVFADTPFPEGVHNVQTYAWRLGAWGAAGEYPAHVFFWNNRLGWAGRRRFWLSVPSDYENHSPDIVGQIRTDSAINRAIESPEANAITWAHGGEVLLLGTEGSEFIVRKSTENEPLGPANIEAYEKSAYGSRAVRPVRAAQGVLLVQKSGRRVRELLYDVDSGAYQAPDLTTLAPRLPAAGVIDWAWQQEPDRILWIAMGDGALWGLTLDREQEVIAWHRHNVGGAVESVQVIPSPDGSRDDVWLIVRRTVGGSTRRFVELLEPGHEEGEPQSACYFVDCGLSYSGAPISELQGLDHLNGETVTVLADGGVHRPLTVVNGRITLDQPAAVVHAGLGFTSYVSPMPVDDGAARGTAQGKTKRIDHVDVRVFQSLGFTSGPSLARQTPIKFRDASVPLGTAPPLFTGDIAIEFDGDYGPDAPLWFVQSQPLPMTILALMPEVTTHERG